MLGALRRLALEDCLCQGQLDELVDGGAEAVGVLAAGRSEVGLSAAAALHQLGSLADAGRWRRRSAGACRR